MVRVIYFEKIYKKKEPTGSAPLERTAPSLNRNLDKVLPSGFKPMSKRKRYLSSYSLNNLKRIETKIFT